MGVVDGLNRRGLKFSRTICIMLTYSEISAGALDDHIGTSIIMYIPGNNIDVFM